MGTAAEMDVLLRLKDEATAGLKQAAQALAAVEKQMGATATTAGATQKATSGLEAAFVGGAKAAAGFATAQIGIHSAATAVTAAISGTVGVAANFEQALANVKAATGATAAEMASFRAEALKIGADTSKSASEAVGAMGELTKAGLSVQDVVGGVGRTVVQLSEATGASTSEMANLVTNSLHTFGLAASDAAGVADLLAKSTNASAIDIHDFGYSLQAVGPVAKLAGLTMADLSTAIGLLGNNALKGQDAGTSLKTMLTALAAPTKEAQKEMQQLGIHLYDAAGKTLPFRDVVAQLQTALAGATDQQQAFALKTIFGQDAIRAGTILLKEGTAGWDAFNKSVAAAPDVAAQSAARLNTLQGQIEQLKGSLETVGITIGTALLPALTNLAKMAVQFTNGLQSEEVRAWGDALAAAASGADQLVGALNSVTGGGGGGLGGFLSMLAQSNGILGPVLAGWGALNDVVQEHFNEQVKLKAAFDASLGTMAGPLAAATITYTQALKDMDKAHASLADKATFLGAQYNDLTTKLNNLNAAHQLDSQEATNLRGSLAAVADQAAALGLTITTATDGTVTFTGKTQEATAALQTQGSAAAATANQFDLFSQVFPAIAAKAADSKKPIDEFAEALKAIGEAAKTLSPLELALNKQSAALDSLASSAKAAFSSSTVETISQWTSRAHEMADAAGLDAEQTAKLHKEIDVVAQKGPAAAGALADIAKQTEAAKGPITDVTKASQDYRTAQEAAAEATVNMGRTLEQTRDLIKEMVRAIQQNLGIIPQEFKGMITEVGNILTVDMSQPGAELALSYASGIRGKTVEITGTAATIGRQVAAALGIDLSAAGANAGASFAAGLASMNRVVANAAVSLAQSATGALHGALEIGSPSVIWMDAGENSGESYGLGVSKSKAEAVGQVKKFVTEVIAPLSDALADLQNARQWEQTVARINTEIARLQLNLAYAEPMSAYAASLEADIKVLEAWKGQIEKSNALLAAQRAELEATRGAVEGFADATAKAAQVRALTGQFGTAGGGIAGLLQAAIGTDKPAGGEELSRAVEAWIDEAIKKNLPNAAAAGELLRSALADALAHPGDPAFQQAAQTALAAFNQIFVDNAPENARLTAQTVMGAYREALAGSDAQQQMGSAGAALWGAWQTATTKGGQDAINQVGKDVAAYEATIRAKLPPAVADEVMGEFWARWNAVADGGDGQAVDSLRSFLEQQGGMLDAASANYAKLPPVVRASFDQLRGLYEAHAIDAETFKDRMAVVTSTIPANFAKLPVAVQSSLALLTQAYDQGVIDQFDYKDQSAAVIAAMGTDWAKYPDFVRTTILDITNQLTHGAISLEEYRDRTSGVLAAVGGDYRKYDAEAQAALHNIAAAVAAGTMTEIAAMDARQAALDAAAERARKTAAQAAETLKQIQDMAKILTGPSSSTSSQGSSGQGPSSTQTQAFSIPGVGSFITSTVQDAMGTFVSASVSADVLAAYGGNMEGFLRDMERRGIRVRASGGYTSGWTWVGERGPELVKLPGGSYVHSNQDSMAMTSGGGSEAALERAFSRALARSPISRPITVIPTPPLGLDIDRTQRRQAAAARVQQGRRRG